MNNETRLRSVFLTCWVKDITQSDLLFNARSIPNLLHIGIGAIELTEQGLEHFHCILTFRNGIRFTTLKNYLDCDSIHIESLRAISDAFSYITKEGSFYNDFDLIENKDIYSEIINCISNGMSLQEVIKKFPKFCIIHYQAIKNIYELFYLNKD